MRIRDKLALLASILVLAVLGLTGVLQRSGSTARGWTQSGAAPSSCFISITG